MWAEGAGQDPGSPPPIVASSGPAGGPLASVHVLLARLHGAPLTCAASSSGTQIQTCRTTERFS